MEITMAPYKYLWKSPCETLLCLLRVSFEAKDKNFAFFRNFGIYSKTWVPKSGLVQPLGFCFFEKVPLASITLKGVCTRSQRRSPFRIFLWGRLLNKKHQSEKVDWHDFCSFGCLDLNRFVAVTCVQFLFSPVLVIYLWVAVCRWSFLLARFCISYVRLAKFHVWQRLVSTVLFRGNAF